MSLHVVGRNTADLRVVASDGQSTRMLHGGSRHTPFDRRRYAYRTVNSDAIIVDIEDNIGGIPSTERVYYIARSPRYAQGELRMPPEYLCWSGHWIDVSENSRSAIWGFNSERVADEMVRRLAAGMPVHRDRWLGIGALLLVGAEIAQAISPWVPAD